MCDAKNTSAGVDQRVRLVVRVNYPVVIIWGN